MVCFITKYHIFENFEKLDMTTFGDCLLGPVSLVGARGAEGAGQRGVADLGRPVGLRHLTDQHQSSPMNVGDKLKQTDIFCN